MFVLDHYRNNVASTALPSRAAQFGQLSDQYATLSVSQLCWAGAALHAFPPRAPLTLMVLALMTLTAIGSYGFLTRAHLQRQVAAQEAVAA